MSKSRIEIFKDKCQNGFHYGKLLKKIKEPEFDLVVAFIEDHEDLDKGQFEFHLNRMFLDKPKPKNWAVIQELLALVNSAFQRK